MPLPSRRIGSTNVPAIGFGLISLSAYKFEGDEERFKVLDVAAEEGCIHWDTSDVYADSEDLVGKWFERTGKRDQIFLATKFGMTQDRPNGKPEYVKSAIEKSLKRLGVETIDLYYLHRADPTIPIEITIGAMAELVKEGKVRYLGLSEVTEATLRRAHKIHPIAALEIEYSPFFLDIEDEKIGLLKACRELNVAVVAYSPLGRGMLTGTYKSYNDIPENAWKRTIPKFGKDNFPNILKLVHGLETLGLKYNATPGQVALAWLLAQGEDIIPIPGTKNVKYLKENIGAAHVQLDVEDISSLRDIANNVNAVSVGDRYPPAAMQWVLADTPSL